MIYLIIRLFFILIILFILRFFIIKYDFFDFFNISLLLFIILFSFLYIFNFSLVYFLISIILIIILIIYSYFNFSSHDNSIIAIDGVINFNNLLKNKCNIVNLLLELKKRKQFFLYDDICIILKDNKYVFYSKKVYTGFIIPIVFDGKINLNGLRVISKGRKWLELELINNHCNLYEIKFAFYFDSFLYIMKK